jgi:hypothetical protein
MELMEILPAPTAEDFESIKSTLLSLESLQVATNNFDESNKLGQGGFGAVYKVMIKTSLKVGSNLLCKKNFALLLQNVYKIVDLNKTRMIKI